MAGISVISGQFGGTSFAGSPVIIRVSGLSWPENPQSPFTIVSVKVKYDGNTVGEFKADTGQQTSIDFDISSALRAIWADYDFSDEVPASGEPTNTSRSYRTYQFELFTEYINTDGHFEMSNPETISGGSCAIGWLTELERSRMSSADISSLLSASTKPTSSPERVGRNSITSQVGLSSSGTSSTFYAADASGGPTVLRDSIDYVDFLFVNRRGAVETCSGQTLEAMDIEVTTAQYARVERPTFAPTRSLMAVASGGRRSWSMSSGYQTREWAEWWAQEFLMSRQWWMRYPIGDAEGTYVPVIVTPAKKSVGIYDRTKQGMPHVDFTVTLALEG